jgi:hypothetical protein
MGGFVLKTSDFPQGFPINAAQLYELVKNGQVDFPEVERVDLKERNKADGLSKFVCPLFGCVIRKLPLNIPQGNNHLAGRLVYGDRAPESS